MCVSEKCVTLALGDHRPPENRTAPTSLPVPDDFHNPVLAQELLFWPGWVYPRGWCYRITTLKRYNNAIGQKEGPEEQGSGWLKMLLEFQAVPLVFQQGEAPPLEAESCFLSLLGRISMRQPELGRFPELPSGDLAAAQ